MTINDFQTNIPLAQYSNYGVGGPAEYFFIAKTKEDLISAVKLANENGINVTVLGGGKNIIINDFGVKGLVIINQYQEIKIEAGKVYVSSGYVWTDFVKRLVENHLGGYEATIGIPGTVGGAIIGNAACFGQTLSDHLVNVEVVNEKGAVEVMTKEDCVFTYRSSIFKQERSTNVVLSAVFELRSVDNSELQAKIDEVTVKRQSNEPKEPSCGSTFKHLDYNLELIDKLKVKGVEIPWTVEAYKRINSKILIQECGLTGKCIGGMCVSEINPNFVVNKGSGKADEFVQLVSYIKQQVRDTFGVQLEEEVRYIGF